MFILGFLAGGAVGAGIAYLLCDRNRAVLAERIRQLHEGAQNFQQAFATVSSAALRQNNEAFLQLAQEKFAALSAEASGSLEQRKAQIEGMLKPMQEVLKLYQSRLNELEKSRVESYSMLREQLGTLAEA